MSAGILGTLVPARFLCLTAHLVIVITLLISRDMNVKAGLPLSFSASDYDQVDARYVIALIATLVCLAVEYFGFFGGFSTFMMTPSLISTCLHATACICLAFFIWDVWDSDLYWWLFGLFVLIPALIELIVLVGIFALKKMPS